MKNPTNKQNRQNGQQKSYFVSREKQIKFLLQTFELSFDFKKMLNLYFLVIEIHELSWLHAMKKYV